MWCPCAFVVFHMFFDELCCFCVVYAAAMLQHVATSQMPQEAYGNAAMRKRRFTGGIKVILRCV
jgi:hypothetical protein